MENPLLKDKYEFDNGDLNFKFTPIENNRVNCKVTCKPADTIMWLETNNAPIDTLKERCARFAMMNTHRLAKPFKAILINV